MIEYILVDSEECTNMSREYERWLFNESFEKEYEQSVLDEDSREVPYDDSDDYDDYYDEYYYDD